MTKYQQRRNARRYFQSETGRFRGGKLVPVMCVPVEQSEAGFISQTVTMELDPIAGRMITQIGAELLMVAVPMQAIDALKNPSEAYAGLTEVLREKYLSDNPVWALENEGEISKRCGVIPSQISGVKRVSEDVRIGHNAAVNFLRQRKYVKATTILAANTAITPALIGDTVLDRFNAVLDPEDRVNGMVEFQTGTITSTAQFPATTVDLKRTFLATTSAGGVETFDGTPSAGTAVALASKVGVVGGAANPVPGVDIPATTLPVNLSGLNVGAVSLLDFYQAEKMDKIVRDFRQMIDANPEYGEEMAIRWAHGLSIDSGKTPILVAERRAVFGRDIVGAMDTAGVEDDVKRSDFAVQISVTVPIPASELGWNVYTFLVLKPDETLAAQPHPVFGKPRGGRNYAVDELSLEPQPVTIRELDANCAQALETTVAMYVGHNEMLRNYQHYGLNRHLDPNTVANKTAIWQLEIPISVTPDNILYPADLPHYPFADQLAEVCTYTIASSVNLQTPIIFGPTPVEELAALETDDVFEENP